MFWFIAPTRHPLERPGVVSGQQLALHDQDQLA